MKITSSLAVLAVSALALTSAKAQSQLSGECSCIAASPRVRQMMQDSCAMYPAMGGSDYISGESVQKHGTRGELVMRPRAEVTETGEPRASIIVDNEPDTVGYKATCHGITAPPRVQQMLKDQRTTVELAPVR